MPQIYSQHKQFESVVPRQKAGQSSTANMSVILHFFDFGIVVGSVFEFLCII